VGGDSARYFNNADMSNVKWSKISLALDPQLLPYYQWKHDERGVNNDKRWYGSSREGGKFKVFDRE